MTYYRHILRCVEFILIAILAACAQATSGLSSPSSAETSVQFRSATPIASQTASATQMPAILPTWTLLPTLLPNEASDRIAEWLRGTPDCLLPCWGGIDPENTTWQEAKQLLSPAVVIDQIAENVECRNGPCNVVSWHDPSNPKIYGSVVADPLTKLVNEIGVRISRPVSNYRLDSILDRYGPPAWVFMWTRSSEFPFNGSSAGLSLELILAYPNHQFIITYFWEEKLVGENLVSCIQDGGLVNVTIIPISGEWTDDIIKGYGNIDMVDPTEFRSLEDVTNMTIDEFYNTFKTIEGGECISTPAKDWP